jgi:hypothetical protein
MEPIKENIILQYRWCSFVFNTGILPRHYACSGVGKNTSPPNNKIFQKNKY